MLHWLQSSVATMVWEMHGAPVWEWKPQSTGTESTLSSPQNLPVISEPPPCSSPLRQCFDGQVYQLPGHHKIRWCSSFGTEATQMGPHIIGLTESDWPWQTGRLDTRPLLRRATLWVVLSSLCHWTSEKPTSLFPLTEHNSHIWAPFQSVLGWVGSSWHFGIGSSGYERWTRMQLMFVTVSLMTTVKPLRIPVTQNQCQTGKKLVRTFQRQIAIDNDVL